jgi:hypothetical protein
MLYLHVDHVNGYVAQPNHHGASPGCSGGRPADGALRVALTGAALYESATMETSMAHPCAARAAAPSAQARQQGVPQAATARQRRQ